MADALKLSGVRAGYGETVVLEDVDLELPERGALAVLGRNGVGKSTLLATIMGHTTFHTGKIDFKGQPIAARAVYERNRIGIGYVPQERMIFPSLSVHENLDVARRPGRWTSDGVYDLFPRLKERRAALGNQLSGGEQQMLAIGRALMGNPSLLLLDEPAAGVPSEESSRILKNLENLPAEIAILIIEHDMDLVFRFAQRITVLVQGTVLVEAPPEEIARDKRVHQVYLGEQHA